MNEDEPLPEAGARIHHELLGDGVVLGYGSTAFGASIVIDFDRGGKKELIWCLCYNKVEVVDDEGLERL